MSRPDRSGGPSAAVAFGVATLLAAGAGGCGDDTSTFVAIPPPTNAGCTQSIPRTFQVYFVINVSGSMNEFLEPLADELETFVESFPDVDINGDALLVDYYVVAFVNDVAFFPEGAPRMTSEIAVAQAIDDALERATNNRNLNGSDNSEPTENMLDALDAALDNGTDADRVLFLIATQDQFADEGERLLPNFTVASDYDDIRERMDEVRRKGLVYAFTNGEVDGIDRNFELREPIPTDGLLQLSVLQDEVAVGGILSQIAEEVACGDSLVDGEAELEN